MKVPSAPRACARWAASQPDGDATRARRTRSRSAGERRDGGEPQGLSVAPPPASSPPPHHSQPLPPWPEQRKQVIGVCRQEKGMHHLDRGSGLRVGEARKEVGR